ncbi:MAG: PQQ-dependent sugar dehydrogenase [Acidobacteriota bacterium]|nr:MAG: PQQ-dependent sugar dehydrogenase [Acidobacteriota bacterium]
MERSVSRVCMLLLSIGGLAALFYYLSNTRESAVSAQAMIQLVPVAEGLNSPIFATGAGDGSKRFFILEQPGRILVMLPGAAAPLPTPFLNISSKVSFGGERGLLGLAFHPQFASNRRFFVNYTRTGDGATVISEFKASTTDPNVAETTEKTILTVDQPFSNHNGGMIDFGADGYLYIGMGDGGSANDPGDRSQNINNLLGKMLRIDVDTPNGNVPYSSPASNPFFGSTPGADEIYATGLRNPWRWSFDRQTQQLYAGDVGQGQREEVSLITLGGNYGWRVLEGTRCTSLGPAACNTPGFIAPLIEYSHSGDRCSITGGYVYRGTRGSLPVGSYVFGDYCTGEIFIWNNNSMSLLRDTGYLISSFAEDDSGEIYVIDIDGAIYRLSQAATATVVSAANYAGAQLATESIVAAFGTGLAANTQSAPENQPLPTMLGGAGLSVTDSAGVTRQALLFFVSPNQINFQIPQGTAAGNATINFRNETVFGAAFSSAVSMANVVPSVFSANASGSGVAAAVVQRTRGDGTQTFEPVGTFDQGSNQFVAVPIDLGPPTDQVFLILFGTGFRYRSALANVNATVGGSQMQVAFLGAHPTLIGLDQGNIRLDRSLIGRGVVDVGLTVDGKQANIVTIRIN